MPGAILCMKFHVSLHVTSNGSLSITETILHVGVLRWPKVYIHARVRFLKSRGVWVLCSYHYPLLDGLV